MANITHKNWAALAEMYADPRCIGPEGVTRREAIADVQDCCQHIAALESENAELLAQIESERKEYRDAANEGARQFREENDELEQDRDAWKLLAGLREEKIKRLKQDASSEFLRGVVEGLTKYAWWADGTLYVGTCGTTLQRAIERVTDEYKSD